MPANKKIAGVASSNISTSIMARLYEQTQQTCEFGNVIGQRDPRTLLLSPSQTTTTCYTSFRWNDKADGLSVLKEITIEQHNLIG